MAPYVDVVLLAIAEESETASKSVRDSRILVDSNKTPDTTVDSVTLSDSTWNLL